MDEQKRGKWHVDMGRLTDEQEAIVHHPMGKHARVLAVAGSGKTTTMVARIKYLVEEQGIDQQMIDVYMFNADAADHFREKLSEEMPGQTWKGNVHTFHAVALGIIEKGVRHRTIAPYRERWYGDQDAKRTQCVRSIIKSMVHEGTVAEGELTAEEALRLIGVWKSSMITPKDASYEATPQYVQVYEEFERKRREVPALTFDDFVPVAVNILANDPELLAGEVSRRAFMIIDEYQDINEGQQRLMELLAGDRSDVMVVGDDDQTIYEWRGARPEYILNGFDRDFPGKPVVVYPLSHSFRFGPLLAQSAYNVISENQTRAPKELIAHDFEATTEVSVIDADASTDSQLAQRMSSLLGVDQVSATDVMTLGRTYAQMEPLEAACLLAHVPFVVPKTGPFFARAESLVLVDYMRLALSLDMNVGDVVPSYQRSGRIDPSSGEYRGEAAEMVLSTINAPRRYVARDEVKRAMLEGSNLGLTIRATLERLSGPESPIERTQARFQVGEYLRLLVRIVEHTEQHPGISAGTLMSWILDASGYAKNPPTTPAGDEDNPNDLEASVKNFVDYACQTTLGPHEFIDYLGTLDTTCGKPEGQCVIFTSIHRAKGLEADYVFLPGCNDGVMPFRSSEEVVDGLLNDSGNERAEASSRHVESERRLFYVAVTRACKHLYIGTSERHRSPFLDEMRLEETRKVVDALLGVVRSKSRDADDAACRSLIQICADSAANEKITRYVLDHYVNHLNIPSLRQRIDDAAAQQPTDNSGVRARSSVGPISVTAVRGGSARPATASWQEFFRHNPDWRPAADAPVAADGQPCNQLYHITSISNVASILVSGVQCWDRASKMPGCTAFDDRLVRRRTGLIPLTGRNVTAYVPLSCCARSLFLHELTCEQGISGDDVVILCFDTQAVLALPGTIYSNREVRCQSAEFYNAREFPEHIDWSAVNATTWPATAEAARGAEVLISDGMSPALIVDIIVNSQDTLERIQDILCDLASASPAYDRAFARCMGMFHAIPSPFCFPAEVTSDGV